MKTITLYEDNRLDNKKEVPLQEIHEGFINFEYFKISYPYVNYQDCLRWYVASKEGLHSSFDEKDFDRLYDYSWKRYKL